MAKRFTRNIRSIKDIEKQPKNTNQQNDLLSDDKHVYVRNKDQYENLTNSVKTVNGKAIDENGNVNLEIKDFPWEEIEKARSDIDSNVSDVQSKAGEASESIDEASNEVNTAKAEAINNMNESDISDKNYLLDSKKRVLEERSTGQPKDNASYDSYYLSEPIPAGTEFTVSGKLEITDGDFDAISILFRDENGASIGHLHEVEHINNEFSSSFTLSKTFYRFDIYAGIYGSTRGNGVIYTDVKLQTGPLATPWTPNPQQIVTQDQYDKLANAIINLGGSI